MPGQKDERQAGRIKVTLAAGANTDAYGESTPVSDLENVEMLPDGSGVVGRRGTAILRKYRLPRHGANTRIYVDSQPPNITDGRMLAVVAGPDGIMELAAFKPTGQLAGDTLRTRIAFEKPVYDTTPPWTGTATMTVRVLRLEGMTRAFTVNYATSDGTASAPGDYTAASGTLSFAAGEPYKDITLTITNGVSAAAETFFVTLSGQSAGVSISQPNPCTVRIIPSYAPFGWAWPTGVAGHDRFVVKMVNLALQGTPANVITAHYLSCHPATYVAAGEALTARKMCVRLNQTTLAVAYAISQSGTPPDATAGRIYIEFYSIPTMLSSGGAFLGLTPPLSAWYAAARVDAPISSMVIPTTYDECTNYYLVPWKEDKFLVVARNHVYWISLETFAEVATKRIAVTTAAGSQIPTNFAMPRIDRNARLLINNASNFCMTIIDLVDREVDHHETGQVATLQYGTTPSTTITVDRGGPLFSPTCNPATIGSRPAATISAVAYAALAMAGTEYIMLTVSVGPANILVGGTMDAYTAGNGGNVDTNYQVILQDASYLGVRMMLLDTNEVYYWRTATGSKTLRNVNLVNMADIESVSFSAGSNETQCAVGFPYSTVMIVLRKVTGTWTLTQGYRVATTMAWVGSTSWDIAFVDRYCASAANENTVDTNLQSALNDDTYPVDPYLYEQRNICGDAS